jgi:nitrite reductase/ring-hydroxylating ferredoxin subunit
MAADLELDHLVDTEAGTISRELFVNRGIYEQELERIFARAWLLIGHEGLVPAPDDFFVTRMGNDSVLLTRNRQGEILAFLNSCPHRGMRVCRYDQGSAPVFTCPYHGWSFSTNRERVEPARGSAPVEGGLLRSARPGALGAGALPAGGELQGFHLGELGPGGACPGGLPGRHAPLPGRGPGSS